MKSLIKWIRPSVEGPDGKSSARALTNLWYVGLNTAISVCIIILAFKVIGKTEAEVNSRAIDAIWALIYLSLIYNGTILLIFGIVSLQQISELSRSIRGHQIPQDPVTVETKTTTEIKANNEQAPG